MYFKSITLTTALLLSMTSGIDSYAALPRPNTEGATNEKSLQGDMAEWELLRAYLREVEKRSDLEIQFQEANYKFRELVFKESNIRWWEVYKENQKQNKIREYWQRFRAGEKYAQLIAAKSVGNYCKLLGQVDLSVMNSPVEDETIYTAFQRGYKGAYPECSIPNLDKFLRDAEKSVSAIEKRLESIQIALLTKPNEKDMEVIYNGLKNKYVEVIKNHITASKEKLEQAFVLPATELNRLMESAHLLAQAIGCSTFISKNGEKYICTARVIEAPAKLGMASTYRILKKSKRQEFFNQVSI